MKKQAIFQTIFQFILTALALSGILLVAFFPQRIALMTDWYTVDLYPDHYHHYSISGRVTDASGNPIAGVTVSAFGGPSATTGSDGYYTIWLPGGTYTVVPSRSGYTFSPPSRTVTVPPNATGVDFTGSPLIELVGQIGGPTSAVAVQGNYAYIGVGPRLVILNVSDPAHPTVVGKADVLPDIVQDVAVSGSYAYVADGDAGLHVINISNPSSPVEVGFYDTPGYAYGVALSGSYAYVADYDRGLSIINISDPSSPTEVGFYDTPWYARDVAVSGSYAYVANWTSGLRIINISNPSNPTEAGSYDTPGWALGVAVSGAYAYIADGDIGLRIINISDPFSPAEVGFYDTPGAAVGVAVSGSYAYVADGGGLCIINISNPSSPTGVGFYETPGFAGDVAVSGSYAYVAAGDGGLRIINLSPDEVGFYDTSGDAADVAVSGSYAYVADGDRGLRIINISNPSSPTEVGFYDTPGDAEGVVVLGSYAYVADGRSGLRIINISNPSNPTEVGFYDTPGFAYDVAVSGSYAYVADTDAGLQIINISNPTNPTWVGSYDTPGYARDVVISEPYAYVADGEAGLRIINISNPSSPTGVGFYDTPDIAKGVAVLGSYAYVADGLGLHIINITNPSSPALVGFYDTPGAALGVVVFGNHAYVAADWSGLRIINISNPSSPTEVGFYDTPGCTWRVAISGSYAYVADGRSGLRIITISTPSSPYEVSYYETTLRDSQGVTVAGNYAYVADGEFGLYIINVSTPSSLAEVGFYDTPGYDNDVAVSGAYAYAANGNAGLCIINISNPSNPTRVGFYDTPGYAHRVAVSGSYAYVADGDSLRIINISNPSNPTEVGSCDTPGYYDVAVSGAYAYIAGGGAGLRIINISNPSSPTEVGSCDTPGSAMGVAVSGPYAYVADGDRGLRIINVANPFNPTEVGFYDTPGYAYDVAVSGSHAYVADGERGLRIINVSNPSSPTEVGFYDTPGYAYGVAVSGSYVYVANGDVGLFILRFRGVGLSYTGPLYLPVSGFMVDEVDGRITAGDHVHLRLPFRNDSTQTITNASVWLCGAVQAGSRSGVNIYNGTSWRNCGQTVTLMPSTLAPGQTGIADFWMYVTNNDPTVRNSLYGDTWLQVATGGGQWMIRIRLSPIAFNISGNEALKGSSCLHHPDNFAIRRYAQYAAGAMWMSTPPTNNGDPDTPEQAIRNLVQRVHGEFYYRDRWSTRQPDAVLLSTRYGYIGVARDYADLTTGLLRALGIPARYTDTFLALPPRLIAGPLASLREPSAHAWVEAYLGAGGWRQADSAWGKAFEENIYEARGYRIWKAWADRYPLSSASIWVSPQYQCIPPCYASPPNCPACFRESNRWQWLWGYDLSCVEDVTTRYHQTGVRSLRLMGSEELMVRIQAPILVTRTLPFTLETGIVNSTTLTLSPITVTVGISEYVDSEVTLFQVDPPYQSVSSLNPGEEITVTWTVTPLLTGNGLPLRVMAENGDYWDIAEQPVVVKEPDAPLPLTLDGLCGPGTVRPGMPISITAYVLDETLRPLTDTLTAVTATVYATPTLAYSATLSLIPDAEGFFKQTLNLPEDAPTGTYWVDFTATHPGYAPAYGASAFFVAPPLTMTLTATPTVLTAMDVLTITAQVYEQGMAVRDASVRAEIGVPNGQVILPLVEEDGTYVASFRPVDLAPNLGGTVWGGEWWIAVTADYYGSEVDAVTSVTVLYRLYLPLVLRNYP